MINVQRRQSGADNDPHDYVTQLIPFDGNVTIVDQMHNDIRCCSLNCLIQNRKKIDKLLVLRDVACMKE